MQALDAVEQPCYCDDLVWHDDKQLNTKIKILCWEVKRIMILEF